jgi:hypothetical protein
LVGKGGKGKGREVRLFFPFFLSFLSFFLQKKEGKKTPLHSYRTLDLDRGQAAAGLEDGLELGLGGAGAVDGAVGEGRGRGQGLRGSFGERGEKEKRLSRSKGGERKKREQERKRRRKKRRRRRRRLSLSQPQRKERRKKGVALASRLRAFPVFFMALFRSHGVFSNALHRNAPRPRTIRARKVEKRLEEKDRAAACERRTIASVFFFFHSQIEKLAPFHRRSSSQCSRPRWRNALSEAPFTL